MINPLIGDLRTFEAMLRSAAKKGKSSEAHAIGFSITFEVAERMVDCMKLAAEEISDAENTISELSEVIDMHGSCDD